MSGCMDSTISSKIVCLHLTCYCESWSWMLDTQSCCRIFFIIKLFLLHRNLKPGCQRNVTKVFTKVAWVLKRFRRFREPVYEHSCITYTTAANFIKVCLIAFLHILGHCATVKSMRVCKKKIFRQILYIDSLWVQKNKLPSGRNRNENFMPVTLRRQLVQKKSRANLRDQCSKLKPRTTVAENKVYLTWHMCFTCERRMLPLWECATSCCWQK